MHNARMPFKPAESLLPLTPISFEILLALHDGELHGYAILQAVEARLAGRLPMRTGTIYRALARLLDEGLIERSDATADDDPRRRYYAITRLGRETAKAEARRLADQVDAARAHRLLPSVRK
ncbi:MAG TPA: PadR family transcriptional regulator [Vicinamibacterales bacterium]|nr:PadR family transcriptional regulator [Vicinamibacterales bacterium]